MKKATPPLDYPREKFGLAIEALATSSASIQRRLYSAALCILMLRPRDLPEEMGDEFDALWRELTREKPIADEGTMGATILNLSDEQAEKFAKRIFNLYTTVCGGM